ncbi:MAG: DNA polymerase III subunit delta [Planctomycetota bacterium]
MAKRAATTKKKAGGVELGLGTRVLVLHGPEEALKRGYVKELRGVLEAEHGELDGHQFDGKTVELSAVMDELRGYSLMAGYKLVVVDEADAFVKAHRAALERYCESPVDHATLVLRAGTWNRGNLDKAIAKVGAIVKCEAVRPAEAAAWAVERAKTEHGVELDRRAAGLLVERMGVDLGMLETEVAKLALMAPPAPVSGGAGEAAQNPSASAGFAGGGGGKITLELVREVVGQGSDEKAWVVQAEVLQGLSPGSGDASGALRTIKELVELSGQPAILVGYAVADLMRKLAVGVAMRSAGEGDQAITKAARVWGPQVRPFMAVVGALGLGRGAAQNPSASAGFGVGRVSGMLGAALEADARSKSGYGEAVRNLECLCVALADNA